MHIQKDWKFLVFKISKTEEEHGQSQIEKLEAFERAIPLLL